MQCNRTSFPFSLFCSLLLQKKNQSVIIRNNGRESRLQRMPAKEKERIFLWHPSIWGLTAVMSDLSKVTKIFLLNCRFPRTRRASSLWNRRSRTLLRPSWEIWRKILFTDGAQVIFSLQHFTSLHFLALIRSIMFAGSSPCYHDP